MLRFYWPEETIIGGTWKPPVVAEVKYGEHKMANDHYQGRGLCMCKPYALVAVIAALLGAGCVSQAQFLDSKLDNAMQTALKRAQFEMTCPGVTGTILSQEVVQPAVQGPWVSGIQRAEYTIGMEGCGKRHTYVVICPDGGEGCFAAGPGRFHGQF